MLSKPREASLHIGAKAKSSGPCVTKQQRKTSFFIFVIVVVLSGIPFGVGKYIELNKPSACDGGAYVYSAQHILNGAKIGVDEKPSAQVGTLLVNILGVWLFGFNEIGPKLMQMVLQMGALVMMFFAVRKLFGTLAAATSVIVASVYLSAPVIAGRGNVKEQYTVIFMVVGMSCFVLWQLGGRWWWCVLAGAFASWAPLFKATGISAIIAIGFFLIVQPLLKHRTWKQTVKDVSLLLAGAGLALAPVCIWLAVVDAPKGYWPYSFAWRMPIPSKEPKLGYYIANSREVYPFAKQLPKVLRYYRKLRLPIALAIVAIIARLVRLNWSRLGRLKEEQKTTYDRFVLLFAVWWVLDMAFVWISPRSYAHYYLPLNASAAMLGGYVIALYRDKTVSDKHKVDWRNIGIAGIVFMVIMSWSIGKSYASKFQKVRNIRKNNLKTSWETVGEHIRMNSAKNDKIYVWGWVPGIYVKAQRFSPSLKAFVSNMHIKSPETLSATIAEILTAFEKEKPKFIVDARKVHFPWDRPPLELWPRASSRFISIEQISAYDAAYSELLMKNFGRDEALRYKAMATFRKFVMKNYKIVPGSFGKHVLFELKNTNGTEE